jgi:hypothetical protein
MSTFKIAKECECFVFGNSTSPLISDVGCLKDVRYPKVKKFSPYKNSPFLGWFLIFGRSISYISSILTSTVYY